MRNTYLAKALYEAMREQHKTAQQFSNQWRAATSWQHKKESK